MRTVKLGDQEFLVAGMLSRFPKCDLLRSTYRKAKGKDCPDLPIVVDKFAAPDMAYFYPTVIFMAPKAFAHGSVDKIFIVAGADE